MQHGMKLKNEAKLLTWQLSLRLRLRLLLLLDADLEVKLAVRKNDYLNKEFLFATRCNRTVTESNLMSWTRDADEEQVSFSIAVLIAVLVSISVSGSVSGCARTCLPQSICHVIHFQPGKQHNQQSWL